MNWQDISSYSRDEEHIPSWWSIKLSAFMLKVGNRHVDYRENPQWFMIFHNGRHEVLGPKDSLTEKEAKIKALEITSDRLARSSSVVFDALMAMKKDN